VSLIRPLGIAIVALLGASHASGCSRSAGSGSRKYPLKSEVQKCERAVLRRILNSSCCGMNVDFARFRLRLSKTDLEKVDALQKQIDALYVAHEDKRNRGDAAGADTDANEMAKLRTQLTRLEDGDVGLDQSDAWPSRVENGRTVWISGTARTEVYPGGQRVRVGPVEWRCEFQDGKIIDVTGHAAGFSVWRSLPLTEEEK
jgi:hypothetical protein